LGAKRTENADCLTGVENGVTRVTGDRIVEHLRTLGYRSFWKRPMVIPQGNGRLECYALRLGPYHTKQTAVEEMARFKKVIEENPMKTLSRHSWLPFVVEHAANGDGKSTNTRTPASSALPGARSKRL